jgi:anthranilate synthase component 1
MDEMIYPSFQEFKKLARKGNVIPVYRDVLADLETPVSAFLKIGEGRYGCLLESVEGQENVGRYSFLAADPVLVFQSKGHEARWVRFAAGGQQIRKVHCAGSPLEELRRAAADFRFVPVKGLPRFCGGFVGYMGYDMVRFFERIPDKNPDPLRLPDCVFMLCDTLIIFDHVNRRMKLVANVILKGKGDRLLRRSYQAAVRSIDALSKKLERPVPRAPRRHSPAGGGRVASNMTPAGFCRAVSKAKEYIGRGDIIQVVLSQQFRARLKSRPFDVYRSLRSVNPSPYMFYLKLGELALVGSSPEMLVRCEDGKVETRPIAGTRPRGKDEKEDEVLAQELLADRKERAEHLMLVDLGRNDLGRVCAYGSVKVDSFMAVEKYSHVMHLVSSVTGRLKKGRDAWDALASCFPAGTVSGAPKIRAMEIIDELESARRGPYAGAIGYFSFSGNLDSCIIIRTIVVKNDRVYIQAGAGIVSDSVPRREFRETVNKAQALFEAVRRAA